MVADRRHRRLIGLLLVLLLGACTSAGTGTEAVATDATPRGERSERGDVLTAEAVQGPDGSTGRLLRYRSESLDGRPIEVTAVALWNEDPAPTPRPIVSWGHGSTGLGDRCAFTPTLLDGRAGEVRWFRPLLQAGYLVIATDYEGLGTPGEHPFLMARSAARSMLDAARAAQQLGDAGATDASPVLLWGHSQGGSGAAMAAELATQERPALPLLGVVAGAPAVHVADLASFRRNEPFIGFPLMVLAGVRAAAPTVDLSDVLTAAGQDALGAIGEGCNETARMTFSSDRTAWIAGDAADSPDVMAVLRGNTPGATRPAAPVLVYHGESDEQVPLTWSRALVDGWCRLGGTALLQTYPGADHVGVVDAALADITEWMDARVRGAPATGC